MSDSFFNKKFLFELGGELVKGVGAALVCHSKKKEKIKDLENVPKEKEIEEILNYPTQICNKINHIQIYNNPVITMTGKTYEKDNYNKAEGEAVEDFLTEIAMKKYKKQNKEINLEKLDIISY